MGDAIEMIAREAEEMFRPKAEWHFRIGVMRAENVQQNEKRDADVGRVRELQPPMRQREGAGE